MQGVLGVSFIATSFVLLWTIFTGKFQAWVAQQTAGAAPGSGGQF
jgi:hypothetical protein